MKAIVTLSFALVLLCTGTGAVLAQTPDGLPPALETVCDMETGAAFGLCNAYCEAMDCELANDSDPLTEPHASANACSRVGSKFQQITGRNLPCEVSCPCSDPALVGPFAAILAGDLLIDACFTEPFLGITDGIVTIDDDGEFTPAFSVLVGEQWICGVVVPGDVLPISPEQGQFCADLLEQAANDQGVICEAPPV